MPTTTNQEIQQFIARYRAEYGEDPTPDALYAYDDVMFLAQALETCGNAEASCISNALLEQTHKGVAGPLDFDKDGVATRPTLLIRYEDDGWQEIS